MGWVSAYAEKAVILNHTWSCLTHIDTFLQLLQDSFRCLRTGVFLRVRVRKVRWDFNNLRRGTLAGKIPCANSA